MKQTLSLFAFISLLTTINGQEILKYTDSMTDRVIWADSPGQVFYDETIEIGFRINAAFRFNQTESIISGVNTRIVGMGCVENVQLIILFEDGTKISKYSWNKFNCDGDAWFLFTTKELNMLANKPIAKIRLTNGYKYKTITVDVEAPTYFITLFEKVARDEYKTVDGW
jgi:hypothetical protein